MYAHPHRYRSISSGGVRRRVARSCWRWFCILVLASAVGALQQVRADVGDRTRIGQAGEWKDTIAAVSLNSRLYSIEKSGALYVTDLPGGRWRQIGKTEFGNTRFMFAAGPSLYTIETDGSLYQVSPSNGAWARVGKAGDWKNTIAGAALNGRLYTVGTDGTLYESQLADGHWIAVGKPVFGNTRYVLEGGNKLYTLDADGSLYSIEMPPLAG